MDPAGVPLVVELRFEPHANGDGGLHVAGTVSTDDGPARPFSGWLALLQVLEALVNTQK